MVILTSPDEIFEVGFVSLIQCLLNLFDGATKRTTLIFH
jgi:hypothetical protein